MLSTDGEVTIQEAEAIANFVNITTGRGNLGKAQGAAVALNTLFFAPKYMVSRFQFIIGQPLWQGNKRTRKLIAMEYARFFLGLAVMYGLADLFGFDIEEDPRSTDFLKIKFGNTRIDPMSGLSQTTVLLSRVISGKTKNEEGEIIPIRGEDVPFNQKKSSGYIWQFLRNKFSPMISHPLNVADGENAMGEPITAKSAITDTLIPMSFRDIYEAMKEHGVAKGSALAIPVIFGIGMQVYSYSDEQKQGMAKKIAAINYLQRSKQPELINKVKILKNAGVTLEQAKGLLENQIAADYQKALNTYDKSYKEWDESGRVTRRPSRPSAPTPNKIMKRQQQLEENWNAVIKSGLSK